MPHVHFVANKNYVCACCAERTGRSRYRWLDHVHIRHPESFKQLLEQRQTIRLRIRPYEWTQ